MSRKSKPIPAGRVIARCSVCRGEAVAKGDGSPVFIRHKLDCPERRSPPP